MKRVWQTIAGFGVIVGIVVGTMAYTNQFASASDLQKVVESVEALTLRIEIGILEDRIYKWNTRKADMIAIYGINCLNCNMDQRVVFASYTEEVDRLQREIQQRLQAP